MGETETGLGLKTLLTFLMFRGGIRVKLKVPHMCGWPWGRKRNSCSCLGFEATVKIHDNFALAVVVVLI